MMDTLEVVDAPGQFEMDRWEKLRATLARTFKGRTRDEWAELFADSDACVSPVLTPWEAPEHPHNAQRSAFVTLDGVTQPAPAPRFDRTPAMTPVQATPADDVLKEWRSDHA